ncbi:MAG: hypothetical protein DMF79_05480 [Acidobacteria bacterium]|nr:MAG: hypothetical protein DMF79_05480 [Acidobacteriota bacterium]
MAPARPFALLKELARGEARIHHFNIVSHHFMSREEILSPLGRERLDMCVFRLPVGGQLVSMCEVNALGTRDRYYEEIRAGREAGRAVFAGETPGLPLGRPPATAARKALRVIA